MLLFCLVLAVLLAGIRAQITPDPMGYINHLAVNVGKLNTPPYDYFHDQDHEA